MSNAGALLALTTRLTVPSYGAIERVAPQMQRTFIFLRTHRAEQSWDAIVTALQRAGHCVRWIDEVSELSSVSEESGVLVCHVQDAALAAAAARCDFTGALVTVAGYISGWPEPGRRWRLYLEALVEGEKAEYTIFRGLGSCGATIAERVLGTTHRCTAGERCLMAAYPREIAALLVEAGRRGA